MENTVKNQNSTGSEQGGIDSIVGKLGSAKDRLMNWLGSKLDNAKLPSAEDSDSTDVYTKVSDRVWTMAELTKAYAQAKVLGGAVRLLEKVPLHSTRQA